MSRMAMALTMLGAFASPSASPAAAHQDASARDKVTIEQAFENYRAAFKAPAQAGCAAVEDEEAIIVCGRRLEVDPNRLPLPIEREAGERVAGEPAIMGPDCIRLCHQPVQVDLIKAVPAVIEGVRKILDPDR